MLIDLHTHSTSSDGTDSPTELVNKAISKKIDVLALTDHDTTRGWDEASHSLLSQLSQTSMQLVQGAEISCQDAEGISIHMLGYMFDTEFQPLLEVLERTRENRVSRMERIIARLNEAGIEISLEDVHAQRKGDATLGRPHLADALVARGHVASRDEAFAALLHNKSKFYINHYSPSPTEVIRLIKSAGGVAVIAHPLASQRGRTIKIDLMEQLVEAGLDGIEIYHRDHSDDEKVQLLQIAKKNDLIVTGSSDYHGTGKQNQLAEFTTHPQQWGALLSRVRPENQKTRLIQR